MKMSSTNRNGSKRIVQDLYPTPLYSIKPLIERIDFSNVKTFLEPCKGDGRIMNLIPDHIQKDWSEISEGRDYLHSNLENRKIYDLIITNPPFGISMDFLNKSLCEGKTICYLQRINWLGSQTRKDFWNNNIPDKLFVLAKRPEFVKEYLIMKFGENVNLKAKAEELELKLGTDSTEYAWFIWDKLNIVKGRHIEVI
jgi:hypothetical protein